MTNAAKYRIKYDRNRVMKNGTAIRPLYVPSFGLAEWETLNELKDLNGFKTISQVVIWCVNKAAGKI